jgi:hypothetical protein
MRHSPQHAVELKAASGQSHFGDNGENIFRLVFEYRLSLRNAFRQSL